MLGDIHSIEIVLLLLLFFVVVFGALAKKLHTPYPIVLVIRGLLLSFIPGIPRITLNPDIVFLVVLPPLLYNAAWLTSWREFSYNLVSILFLAFGLVTFTVVGVVGGIGSARAGLAHGPGLGSGRGTHRCDCSRFDRVANWIAEAHRGDFEGESLLNDATALLALEFGIGLLVGGQRPTVMLGFLRLGYLIVVGVLTGLVIGEIVHQIEHRIDDAPIEIALSLLTPYAAYLSAEQMQPPGFGSGGVRLVPDAKEFALFFSECAGAGVGGVGVNDVCFERPRVRDDRVAVALRIENHQRSRPANAYALRRRVLRVLDCAAPDLGVSGRTPCLSDSKTRFASEGSDAYSEGAFRIGLDRDAGSDLAGGSDFGSAAAGQWRAFCPEERDYFSNVRGDSRNAGFGRPDFTLSDPGAGTGRPFHQQSGGSECAQAYGEAALLHLEAGKEPGGFQRTKPMTTIERHYRRRLADTGR